MAEINEQPLMEFGGLRSFLQEAHETVEAIRAGLVDGFVMRGADGDENIFILEGANHPYRLFVEQMHDGAVTLSPDGTVLYANRRFADLVKRPVEDIIGASFEKFLRDHEPLKALTATHTGAVDTELTAASGATVPVYISHSTLQSGDKTWICLVIMDATQQKRQQAMIQESERLATIGRTAAVLTHEIANPLSGMLTAVQLMQCQVAERGDESLFTEELSILEEEIGRLSTLLTNFRSLSQPTQLNPAPTEVAGLIEETVKLISAESAQAGVEIAQHLSGDISPVPLDRQRIKQVFLNLFKNAIEAMRDGGKLTIAVRSEADGVVIEIADTGPGIPDSLDVFDFFTTTKPEGTGLGLAVVKQIVSAHGGAITYTSESDKGTTFRLSFPLVRSISAS